MQARAPLAIITSTLLFVMFGLSVVNAEISVSEHNALVALYEATNGDQWTINDGWQGAVGTECSWYGITCNAAQTAVVIIDLESNNLVGSIASGIGNFVELRELRLGRRDENSATNSLGGSIPSTVGNLTALEVLNLWGNHLTGELPPEMASLGSLFSLNLDENDLTGELPPWLGSLADLVVFAARGNDFEGSIPSELGALGGLRWLMLSNNRLSGEIPEDLGELIDLEVLWLDGNQLQGEIPPDLGQLEDLRFLWLNSNLLSGAIPPSLGDLGQLISLSLWSNQLSEGIPPELGRLGNLISLALGANFIGGTIPAELGDLNSLEFLYLWSMGLEGEIPSSLGDLDELKVLWLQDNNLEGQIPSQLGATSLVDLSLSNNQLSGALPAELSLVTSLEYFDVRSNRLLGEVPTSYLDLTSLVVGGLDLRWNGLWSEHRELESMLSAVQSGGDWTSTQTVPPNGLLATDVDRTSAALAWAPIPYGWDPGGYRVLASLTPDGPWTVAAETASKTITSLVLTDLAPGTEYYFTVQTVTLNHAENANVVESELSLSLMVTTVEEQGCLLKCGGVVPRDASQGEPVAFVASIEATNCSVDPSVVWDFGDGFSSSSSSTEHSFAWTGSYTWILSAAAGEQSCQESGVISVTGTGTSCGNDVCEAGETAWTCDADCGLGAERTGRAGGSAQLSAVPAMVGGVGGVGTTFWVSEAMIFNPGESPASYRLFFVADDDPANVYAVGPLEVEAGTAQFSANLVGETFGLSSSGSLRLESEPPLMMVTRTFNDQPEGTYGQAIAAVNLNRALAVGDTAYLIGLRDDDAYRSNLLIQEVSGIPTDMRITVFDPAGELIGTAHPTVPAGAKWQNRFQSVGIEPFEAGYATVEVVGGGQVIAIASVVDQLTGDAMTVDGLHELQLDVLPALDPVKATVDFTWSPRTPVVGEAVQFTDLSGDDVDGWSWSFGDGQTSAEANPVHVFEETATYPVTLAATTSFFGTSFATRNVTVVEEEVEEPDPVPHFLVAVVAASPGDSGTTWKSDVWIQNPFPSSQPVSLVYVPVGGDGSLSEELVVESGAQLQLDDVVTTLFGFAGDGKGALHVLSPQGVFVNSRTYNVGADGTYGQTIPALAAGDLLAAGESGVLLKIKSTDSARCNLGFTDFDGDGAEVLVELYAVGDRSSELLGSKRYSIGQGGHLQVNRIFNALGVSGQYEQAFAVVSVTSGGRVYAYASNVDARTGDAEFILAMKD